MGSYRDKTAKNIENGRGKGTLESYTSPIKPKDFSSKGRCYSTYGITVGRLYYFLSSLERDYFDIIDFNSQVVDIRENFPLTPVESTELIAAELGIRHPQMYGEKQIMTSDFYIHYQEADQIKEAVRQVKYAKELENPRVLEKFLIEVHWWRMKGVEDWKIITEREVDSAVAARIRELKGHRDLLKKEVFKDFTAEQVGELAEQLKAEILSSEEPILKVIGRFESETGLPGTGKRLYKHLAFKREVPFDLKKEDFGISEERNR